MSDKFDDVFEGIHQLFDDPESEMAFIANIAVVPSLIRSGEYDLATATSLENITRILVVFLAKETLRRNS